MAVVRGKSLLICGELDPEWAKNRHTRLLRTEEQRIPVRQQTVAGLHRAPHHVQVFLRQQPWLAPSRINVGMGSKERLIGGRLHAYNTALLRICTNLR
jgi:hypothetical protein